MTELSAARGGRVILSGLSFTLAAGQVMEVVGPNGAGKSTLLRVLAGLLAPLRGEAVLEPPAVRDPDTPLAERVHYMGHADALKPALTARENLRFAQALGAGPGLAPAPALARFGLGHALDVPCGAMSAGQRRRVALARLLVSFRPLWLLDEPATALDSAGQAVLAALIEDHLAAGGLVVAATHVRLGLRHARELRLGGAG